MWVWWLVASVGVALTLAVGHWFPWVKRLSRVHAYVYGTATIWLGFMVWRGFAGDWVTPVGLAGLCVVGGATVVLAYRIDAVVLAVRQAQRAEASDDELTR